LRILNKYTILVLFILLMLCICSVNVFGDICGVELYVSETMSFNPSNGLDIAFTKCGNGRVSYVIIWSNIGANEMFHSNTYTTILSISAINSEKNSITYRKFDFTDGLDLMFQCSIYNDNLVVVGVENSKNSVLYMLSRDLSLMNKRVLSNNYIWYTGIVILNNTLYLVGSSQVTIHGSIISTNTIFIEKRSLVNYKVLKKRIVLNTSNELYPTTFITYNAKGGKLFLAITSFSPILKTIVYVISLNLDNITKVLEVNGLLKYIGSNPSHDTMYYLAIAENTIYGITSNGSVVNKTYTDVYYRLLSQNITLPKYPVEEIPTYQDGIVYNVNGEEYIIILAGIGTAYDHLSGKKITTMYLNTLPLGELVSGGKSKALKLKYTIYDLIVTSVNKKTYIIFQGSVQDPNDYMVFVDEVKVEPLNVCGTTITAPPGAPPIYLTSPFNTTTTKQNTIERYIDSKKSVYYYYSIISTIIIILLIGYITWLHKKKKP